MKMTKEYVDARIELDNDIRELVGNAFELFGKRGIMYVEEEVKDFALSLKLNKVPLRIKKH